MVMINASYLKDGSFQNGPVKDEQMFDPYLNKVGYMMCRIDLQYVRPGKDDLPMATTGRAPDRTGVMFCDYTPYLKGQHIIQCVHGPIKGTFEIRFIPEEVQGYSEIHHMECGIVEIAKSLRRTVTSVAPDPDLRRRP